MKNLRLLAILLLDDENGINEAAYNELSTALADAGGNDDILNAVRATEGRFYIGEDDAADLLKVGQPANCCETGQCQCATAA